MPVETTSSFSRLTRKPYATNADVEVELLMRIFMGHRRTVCNCHLCAINCRFIPGYLLPEDLDRIATYLGYSELLEFGQKNLLASPGAIVIKDGRLCRIRTLVPARNDSGWCRFFDGNLCTIHSVAPFGCAFFDSHQEQSGSNAISAKGLQIIAGLWQDQPRSLYCQIWNDLHRRGMRAPAPEECRNKMKEQNWKK
jgi:Fe-S-cluster containining protein